jgi:hypothetical protein
MFFISTIVYFSHPLSLSHSKQKKKKKKETTTMMMMMMMGE